MANRLFIPCTCGWYVFSWIQGNMNVLSRIWKRPFSSGKIKELYHLRWGIETSFRKLKYNIGVSNLHSKKAEYVEQEIYARIIMYNFCESVTAHVTVKQKDQKYVYQINFTMAVHICKFSCKKLFHNSAAYRDTLAAIPDSGQTRPEIPPFQEDERFCSLWI